MILILTVAMSMNQTARTDGFLIQSKSVEEIVSTCLTQFDNNLLNTLLPW